MGSIIRFERVNKVYPDGTRAVDDVTFEIEEGECVTFVGPSGCGKTTTVKLLNRLVEPTSGTIYLNGQDTAKVDIISLRRGIGYVIQDVGLFPHMTVAENIALVPRLIGWPVSKRESRTDELLNLVGLEPGAFRNRYPHQLSGGQRQRVGVARGLAADPPVILMDEPFGALDPITRAQLQDEFLKLRARLRKTILFVTHDIDEAIKLGDRIAVMRNGKIVQFASPATILKAPADPFVRDLVGKERGLKLMKLLKVSDIMEPFPDSIRQETSVGDALQLMKERNRDILMVVNGEGRYLGYVRFERVAKDEKGRVADVMEQEVLVVGEQAKTHLTLERMLKEKRIWLPVVDQEGRPKGVVTMTHFAMFFASDETEGGRS